MATSLRSERGATSVEAAIVFVPFFFFAVLLIVQLTFAFLTHNAAQSAAEHAADATAAREGTTNDGYAVATEIMKATGYSNETTTTISVSGGVVTAEVTAKPVALLINFTVAGNSETPVEEFISSQDRQ